MLEVKRFENGVVLGSRRLTIGAMNDAIDMSRLCCRYRESKELDDCLACKIRKTCIEIEEEDEYDNV